MAGKKTKDEEERFEVHLGMRLTKSMNKKLLKYAKKEHIGVCVAARSLLLKGLEKVSRKE